MTRLLALTFMDLVAPKAAAKRELSFNKPASVEHLSRNLVLQQSVTRDIALAFTNLVALKVGAKCELLFNKLR